MYKNIIRTINYLLVNSNQSGDQVIFTFEDFNKVFNVIANINLSIFAIMALLYNYKDQIIEDAFNSQWEVTIDEEEKVITYKSLEKIYLQNIKALTHTLYKIGSRVQMFFVKKTPSDWLQDVINIAVGGIYCHYSRYNQ